MLAKHSSRIVSVVRALDDRALGWMAATDHGRLRPLLRGFARATDVLAPLLAVSAGVLSHGTPQERRAVVRGWTAVAVTSVIHGAVLKPAAGRQRPDPDRLPSDQRRQSRPSTSSFASGHSSVTAAFSVATGRGVPRLRAMLAVCTSAVAYSQLYTGRHFLSDIVVGTALGTGVGVLSSRLRPEEAGDGHTGRFGRCRSGAAFG